MSRKPIAIVAAMPVELAPLLGKTQSRQVDGVDLFELPRALVAIGGIGEKHARHAAEVVIEQAQPKLLLSAGIAGAISPGLKVGDVGRVREVVDVATGERYSTAGGDWVLVTSQDVSDAAEKQSLRAKYGADVVDMEGAAEAQVAKERGLDFAAIKAISDEAAFVMPPLNRFIEDGKFDTRRFLVYIALHPRWWGTLGRIKKNSEIATANLCEAVRHLIENSG
ncbi:MAG: phosphorylase [Candidatus Korobacteraceae bacterium]